MRAPDVTEFIVFTVWFAMAIVAGNRLLSERNPHYLECSRIGSANVQAVVPPQNAYTNEVDLSLWANVMCAPEQMGQIMWDTKNDKPYTGIMRDRGELVVFRDGEKVGLAEDRFEQVFGRDSDRPTPFFGSITNGNQVFNFFEGRVVDVGELK